MVFFETLKGKYVCFILQKAVVSIFVEKLKEI